MHAIEKKTIKKISTIFFCIYYVDGHRFGNGYTDCEYIGKDGKDGVKGEKGSPGEPGSLGPRGLE